jgi:catechol 2,3-dioxygenase-like lactoylglutathione lyase family enzyme
MAGFRIAHVGLHVRNLEEEIEFLEILAAKVTSTDTLNGVRVAFVSLDGVLHHSLALFEDGEPLPSGNSQKEPRGIHHIALPTDARADVDAWKTKLEANGVTVRGPTIQGPEGGGLANGSGSYAIFFTDPNGVCFEIHADAMTVSDYHKTKAELGDQLADA